jgi:hypothetical protein
MAESAMYRRSLFSPKSYILYRISCLTEDAGKQIEYQEVIKIKWNPFDLCRLRDWCPHWYLGRILHFSISPLDLRLLDGVIHILEWQKVKNGGSPYNIDRTVGPPKYWAKPLYILHMYPIYTACPLYTVMNTPFWTHYHKNILSAAYPAVVILIVSKVVFSGSHFKCLF